MSANCRRWWIMPLLLAPASLAAAMPWDNDMARQPSYYYDEIARPPVKGAVPVGRKPFTLTIEEAAVQLKNPAPATADSLWRGERIWNTQCRVCHGERAAGQTPVGKQMGAPSLLEQVYRERTDGRIFAVINYGGANMPRYGYKIPSDERWHVINYLRFLQGRTVQGFIPGQNEIK